MKAVETGYSRLRYQLGIMVSGSSSGAGRALSVPTTTAKSTQEVSITCTALMLTPQGLDVEGTDRARTGRCLSSQLQGGLAALETLSWQLSHEVKSHGMLTQPVGGLSPGARPGGWIARAE